MRRIFGLSNLKATLDVISTIAFICACGVLIWSIVTGRLAFQPNPSQGRSAAQRPPAPPLPTEPVSIAGDITKGNAAARVAVIEYSEFQCPYCGKFFRETWPTLQREYVDAGSVLWVFRHLPLEELHRGALGAAKASQCAAVKGQFWPMHDLLFSNANKLDEDTFHGYAEKLGLDVPSFERCMDADVESKVRADMSGARQLGVSGTPNFLLGRIGADGRVTLVDRIAGAAPIDEFRSTLSRILSGKIAASNTAPASRLPVR